MLVAMPRNAECSRCSNRKGSRAGSTVRLCLGGVKFGQNRRYRADFVEKALVAIGASRILRVSASPGDRHRPTELPGHPRG